MKHHLRGAAASQSTLTYRRLNEGSLVTGVGNFFDMKIHFLLLVNADQLQAGFILFNWRLKIVYSNEPLQDRAW